MRKLQRVLLGLTVSTGLVAGLAGIVPTATAHPAARPARPAAGIAWQPCAGDSTLQCGSLGVPLDHADPGGPQIRLAVSRRVHTSSAADYQGVIVLNPGGPGAAGTYLPRLADSVPGTVADAYDWVGFDPRGVGRSEPRLACAPAYFHTDRRPYAPRTRSLMRYWLTRTASYAASCGRTAGALLNHLRTTDTVADVESLREALGADRLNFYGFSYGTYLAQVYATQHPDRVRRFVLDGVVDPTRVWYAANLDQSVAFDRAMNRFWRWLARHDRRYHLGTHWKRVRATYGRELRRLTAHPYRGRLGPDELNDAMLGAGYYVYGWRSTADAFSALVRRHDGSQLLAIYRQGDVADPNAYSVYTATTCSDVSWPSRWATWRHDTRRVDRRHPFLAWNNTWYNAPCRTWHSDHGTRVAVSGSGLSVPILLVNETGDAATPFSGALAARRLFPTASLVSGVGGTTHAGSLSGVACVDDTVAAYLRDGTVPVRVAGSTYDRGCPPVPVPGVGARSGRSTTALPTSIREQLMAAGVH